MNDPVQSHIRDAFDDILNEELDVLVSSTADRREETIYKSGKRPVDVIQFVEDPFYLGGQVELQPNVKRLLWDIEDPEINEVDLELGKGSGKSELAQITQCYGAYLVSCLKHPQQFYGLSRSTIIASVNVSIGREQAKDVIFKGISSKIEHSPYFQQLKPIIMTREIELPDNIHLYCGHSADRAFLGYATIRGIMDEVNYMFDNQNRNVAKQLYDALSGSMVTRFPPAQYPGAYKLVSVSSMTLVSTWLNSRITQAKNDGDPYVRRVQMTVEDVQSLGSTKLVRIVCQTEPTDDEMRRTLLVDHQLTLVGQHTGWTRRPQMNDWVRIVEVAPARLHGL